MTIPYKEKAEALEKENLELQKTIDFLLARCANLMRKSVEKTVWEQDKPIIEEE